MLNTDMALFKDINTNADGESSCSFDTCGTTVGTSLVGTYAADNARWIADFGVAFTKMIEHGSATLETVIGGNFEWVD
eukprot:Awhi_evm1s10903